MTENIFITCVWDKGADRSFGLPDYETSGAVGVDLRANFPDRKPVILTSGERVLVPTGIRMAIPIGYEVQIRPRSGLALKHGLTLLNSPGTIDSDYRGTVGIIMVNLSGTPFEIAHGMRVAQAVVAPVVQAGFQLSDRLDRTVRGTGGFGSTGAD